MSSLGWSSWCGNTSRRWFQSLPSLYRRSRITATATSFHTSPSQQTNTSVGSTRPAPSESLYSRASGWLGSASASTVGAVSNCIGRASASAAGAVSGWIGHAAGSATARASEWVEENWGTITDCGEGVILAGIGLAIAATAKDPLYEAVGTIGDYWGHMIPASSMFL